MKREPVHLRRIDCEGFRREDGLFDLVGTLTDVRPAPVSLPERAVAAGEPIHRMVLTLTVDAQRVIRTASAVTEHSPYRECREAPVRYAQLEGLRVEPGFNDKVRRLFRGVAGCTHITEMIPVMASALYQSTWSDADSTRDDQRAIGGCHALRQDGPVVLRVFPRAARPASSDPS